MKRIAYSIFLVALLSCGGPSFNSRTNSHVFVKTRDSSEREYLLLAVRDSAVIVAPYPEEGSIMYGSLMGSAELIPFTKITRIYRPPQIDLAPLGIGGGIGYVLGCSTGTVLGVTGITNEQNNNYNKYIYYPYAGMAIGITAGVLIGLAIQLHDYPYSFSSKQDILGMRSHAFFPNDEPQELQKIK